MKRIGALRDVFAGGFLALRADWDFAESIIERSQFPPVAAEPGEKPFEMGEWTERQARGAAGRRAYVDQLAAAVGGGDSRTWAEAQAALDAATPAP